VIRRSVFIALIIMGDHIPFPVRSRTSLNCARP
jgi:hypothetical protein